MKFFTLMLITLVASLSFARAQTTDAEQIESTIRDYIEGYYTGDAVRVERALHPKLAKRFVARAKDGTEKLIDGSAAKFIELTKTQDGPKYYPEGHRRLEIRIFEIDGDVASAKALAQDWIDYIHLSKIDGKWVIVNVLWKNAPPPHDAVDEIVKEEAIDKAVPGVAVAVVKNGAVLLTRGYGLADVKTHRKVTETTPFNVASVTKVFTATTALLLVRDKKLNLDEHISTYLKVPDEYKEITVRQILNHVSGIARDLRQSNDDDPSEAEYRRRFLESHRSFEAGRQFEYSNTGYATLGWIIEEIEKKPLADVYKTRIFDPLGMLQAQYRVPIKDNPNRAFPYDVINGAAQPANYVSGGLGSGGISLSAIDAARFAVTLQNESLLTKNELNLAWTPGRLADGKDVRVRLVGEADSYGFGWILSSYKGHRLMNHGGGITGYSANFYHFPDDKLTVIVLANSKRRNDGATPVEAIVRRIAGHFLDK